MNQLPNSFYTASLDEVIEKLYNAAADRQLPSVTVLEQSSDGTISVKLVVSKSFLLHVCIYCIVLASVLCLNTSGVCNLKRQCQPQCICLHFTLKVMECQQITIINISLVLCRYNSVKMSKYNHRMVEIYDGLKTKT
jgi:hypothetical protein